MKNAKPSRRRAKAPTESKSAIGKTIKVKILRFDHAHGLPLPAYQTADAAGMDLIAALPDDTPMTLAAGHRATIPTGIAIALPPSTEAQVRPRSGLAAKQGVTVLNSPGTIDADYRGEISVILINLGSQPVVIRRGDRIAQMVLAPVTRAVLVTTASLDITDRGAGGFGSTGFAVSTKSNVPGSKTKASAGANSIPKLSPEFSANRQSKAQSISQSKAPSKVPLKANGAKRKSVARASSAKKSRSNKAAVRTPR